jgi:hypothetical protein
MSGGSFGNVGVEVVLFFFALKVLLELLKAHFTAKKNSPQLVGK